MRVLLVVLYRLRLVRPARPPSAMPIAPPSRASSSSSCSAFLADDAATAYSFAGAGDQGDVPDRGHLHADGADRAIRRSTGRARIDFGELTEETGQLEQIVDIVDAAGVYWTALYTLAASSRTGHWKITGCYLLEEARARSASCSLASRRQLDSRKALRARARTFPNSRA